ncbi:MAG: hypothetical protein ACOH5I_22890 [Oligoflexus sp.]
MKTNKKLIVGSLFFGFMGLGCQGPIPATSDVKVTSVEHTPVKQQSIGNCWLYAHATWMESKLKHTTGETYDVSETYWTYWDFYHKLLNNEEELEELGTGGTWNLSTAIIKKYGWVEEKDFIVEEGGVIFSKAQQCAEKYINEALTVGGSLYDPASRTEENLRAELDQAFSCDGTYSFDMDLAYENRRLAEETILHDAKTNTEKPLMAWLDEWTQVGNRAHTSWNYYEGKKLPTENAMDYYKQLEQRVKRALNDRQPVVLSFYVTFNAPNAQGLFNLNTLSSRGDIGEGGGHMVVLHDYTVNNVPGIGRLDEGDMSAEMKEAALQGDLDYLVAKNSWGANRQDRPWLRNGYSRFSWDYLTKSYYVEDDDIFRPFMQSLIFPPGY